MGTIDFRIISTSGATDLPYKDTNITANEDGCVYANTNHGDDVYLIGEYETKEQACEVLGWIREQYTSAVKGYGNPYYKLPTKQQIKNAI